ncbi:MAG TPA: hypothetical protein VGH64_11305 [Puia sp.]|jgi:hypothetical protein
MTAGAYSIHFKDAFSFVSNAASLGTISGFQSGIVSERKWMLNELAQTGLAVCLPWGDAGLGVLLQQSGDADYNERGLQIAYGKNAGRLQIGTGFSYLIDQAAGYSSAGFGSARAGICFKVSEKLTAGWDLELPVFGIAGKINPERGPQAFSMGFGYEWTPDLFISFEVEKNAGLPVDITAYIEYRYGEQFFFAFGIDGLASAIYFKSGWKKNRFCFQIYTLFEPVLGFSPGIAIFWSGKNRKR